MWHEWSTLKKLIWLRFLQGASAIIKTVTGTAPLVLTNAVNAAITSLTQYGKCVQNGTPTPDVPVDIVCNNGALKIKDTRLPVGFTPVEYVESDGTSAYIDTGIILNSIDLDVEVDFQSDSASAASPKMFWGYMDGSSNLPRWGFGVYNSKWLGSPNGTAPAGEADTDRHTAVMRVFYSSETARYSGTLDGDELYAANSLGNTALFIENDLPVFLFARNNKGTAGNFADGKIYGFKVTKAGTVTHELVPCLNVENEPGFYDLNTQTFHGAAAGTLTAGGADFDPATSEIYIDGTPEVLTVMANKNTDPTIVKVTLASGATEVRYNASSSCIVAPVKPNTVYTIGFLNKPTGGSIFRAATTKTKVSPSGNSAASIAYDLDKNDYEPKTLNSGEDAAWMYVQLSNTMSADDFASIIIQEGTSIHNPQTASVVNLLSVGDIADEQEIISGGVTRKVGIKVLDGTEYNSWTVQSNRVYTSRSNIGMNDSDRPDSGAITCLSTHYADSSTNSVRINNSAMVLFYYDMASAGITTSAEWNAYLAEQYAAGTPVIVLYPLATETTESVTAQPLHTSAGDNTVSVTSNVDPVQLEVQYSATA